MLGQGAGGRGQGALLGARCGGRIRCPLGTASLMVQSDPEQIISWQWGGNTKKLLKGPKEGELNSVVLVCMWEEGTGHVPREGR